MSNEQKIAMVNTIIKNWGKNKKPRNLDDELNKIIFNEKVRSFREKFTLDY